MPIHLPENQYKGINAHLHSYFQQVEDWPDFHASHIVDLRREIQRLLPIDTGYRVRAEQSLQIAQYDLFSNQSRTIHTRADIGITRLSPENQDDMVGIAFYKDERLVTRLEVLSPANKVGGSHYGDYLEKRDATVRSGIKMVEVDYLHERRSPLAPIPNYTQRETQAFPYYVSITELQGEHKADTTRVYGFRVDDALPVIALPLADDDFIVIDFNTPYQATFGGNVTYAALYVDYEQPPLNFESYDEEGQKRIRAVMAQAKVRHVQI